MISPDAPHDAISEMVALGVRIADPGLFPSDPPLTLADIERFRLGVTHMRLQGYLSQELSLRLLHRADLRELTLCRLNV